MRRVQKIILLIVMLAVAGCHRAGYDKTTYDQLQQVIDGSTARLVGLSLDDAIRSLSLEGVPWNEGYSSTPLTQLRIYHFKGFYLLLDLRRSPGITLPLSAGQPAQPGAKPSKKKPEAEQWWVSDIYPALHIDSIKDPQQRMAIYWKGVHEGLLINGQATNQVIPSK